MTRLSRPNQFHDRIGKHLRHFLRHIVPNAGYDPVRARPGKKVGML